MPSLHPSPRIQIGPLIGAVLLSIWLTPYVACTHAPPNLSPNAKREFYATRVIKELDIVRDFAVDGEAAGVVSTDDARVVVLWHKSAVQVAQSTGANWQTIVSTTLDTAVGNLKPTTRDKLAPYVVLIKAILAEVP